MDAWVCLSLYGKVRWTESGGGHQAGFSVRSTGCVPLLESEGECGCLYEFCECGWKVKPCGEESPGAMAREREGVSTGKKLSVCRRKVPF